MLEIQRVDYIRVPVTDIERANAFYGGVLGLPRNPNSPAEDWVEYEAGNVTLAVMTPHTHEYEFTQLPPGTIALRVPDVAAARETLEAAGVQVNDLWDSGVCRGAGFSDPDGNRFLLTTATRPIRTAAAQSPRGSSSRAGTAPRARPCRRAARRRARAPRPPQTTRGLRRRSHPPRGWAGTRRRSPRRRRRRPCRRP
ncbi:MAG: hypothetical protein HOQ03_13260, partial [Thermoleophilia bacterium]|nr:hypothetical protein [Thermoleophilia bacterium]